MERLLQEIIDLMPVGVWVANRQGALVRMNSAARQIWRADPHANLGRFDTYKAWRAATGEEIKPGEWGLDRAIEDGSTSEELIRIQCFDGTERTVVNTAAPLHDEHGRLTGAVAVTEDVTELMAAQSLSHERGELLQTVQDLLPVGVLLFDAQGRLTEANPAARRIWGLDEHDPLPDLADFEAWDAATGEPVRPQAWASTHAVRTGETSRDQLLQIRTFNGSLRTIFNSAAPLRTLKARTAGAVAVNQDVSSLFRAQQQLRAAVRDREQLLALVAHDLRNPLAALALLATTIEGLDRQSTGGSEMSALAAKMQERLHGLAGLVDDLLTISVGGLANASMLDLQKAEPAHLVDQALDQASGLFAARGIRVSTRISPDLPPVMVDRQRLQRVWTNLVDNALKHTEPGGDVSLGATHQGGVVFSVSNSGPALSQEQMQAMFRPFWQARSDRRGAGLGLSIARAIIEAHGGSIWAEAAQGQRVCVKFELPRIELAQPASFASFDEATP